MDAAKTEAWDRLDLATYAVDRNEVYTEWSKLYDQDLELLGYVTPRNVATELFNHIRNATDTLVLDVAAGTGKCAEELKKLQFLGKVDALEINAALLKIAKAKELYRNHFECGVFEDQPLPLEDGSYDAITCVGAMTASHVTPGCVKPMIQALKKGGVLLCTVRATEIEAGFRQKLAGHFEDLVRDGIAEKIAVKEMTHYASKSRETGSAMTSKMYIYKRICK